LPALAPLVHAACVQDTLSLGTPALLFPTISLLLLAFTNRFLTLAGIVRGLSKQFEESREDGLLAQIENLRKRLNLIRDMQAAGVLSLLLCVICMFALFEGWQAIAQWLFGFSLVLMMASLVLSAREIQLSTGALHIHLSGVKKRCEKAIEEHQHSSQAPRTNPRTPSAAED